MSEVIIELDLKRKSGVLAGAVAALRSLSLEFKSQQLVDHQGIPRLILVTEGELEGVDELLEAYATARGVSGVADVRVDGASLLHAPAAPDPEPEPEPEPAPRREAVSQPAPTPAPAAAQAAEPSRDEAFDEEAFAREALKNEAAEKPAAPARPSRPDPETGLTPSMIRRRRRRR